jgi:O-antigen/teichoic acid export membrane protein
LSTPAQTQVEADRPLATDSIARNTFFGLATQLTSAAFTAALTLYLVRALDPSGYGVFALALGIGTLLMLPADFGLAQSAERFIAEHRDERRSVAAVMADTLKLKLLAASVLCGALFAAAGPIAEAYDESRLAWPLRAMAIAVFGQTMMLLYRGSFVALGRVSLTWRITTIESAIETVASVALVVAGGGAAGATFGRAIGYVMGALIALAFAVRILGRRSVRREPGIPGRGRQLAGYAGAVLVVNAAFILFEQIDVLMIGAIIDTAAVGVFEAPLRLSIFLSYGGQAVAFGVVPRLVRRGARPNVEAFTTALRYLTVVQALLLAPVLVWAEPITDLVLGAGYEESSEVLRALAPFTFLSALGTFITVAVNYLGEARRRVPLAIGAVALNAGIDAVLIPEIGVLGGAVGTDIAFFLYVVGHLWICQRLLGFQIRPLLVTLGRCLVAAAIMCAVLAAFGTSALSPAEAVVGGAAGLAVYCLVLLSIGELSRAELATARARLTGLLARR